MSKRKRAKTGSHQPRGNSGTPVLVPPQSKRSRGFYVGSFLVLVAITVVAIAWYSLAQRETASAIDEIVDQRSPGLVNNNAVGSTNKNADLADTPPSHGSSTRHDPDPQHVTSSADADLTVTAVLSTPKLNAQAKAERAAVDPNLDGWVSEAFHDQTMAQLKLISKLIMHPENASPESVSSLISDDFNSTPLRPAQLEVIFSDESVKISRPALGDDTTTVRGADALAAAIRSLGAQLADLTNPYVKLKNVRVELGRERAKTQVFYEADGQSKTGSLAQTATWQCEWSRGEGPAKLESIRVENFEEVVTKTPVGTWFVDHTQTVIGEDPAFQEQLAHSMNHWLRRVERVHGIEIFARNGITVGDVNGDGLEDVYLCQSGHLPNRLYLQNPDGTVKETSASAGVDVLDDTSSALLLDLDNDGDQDLILAISRQLVIFANDSRGNFELRTSLSFGESDVQSLVAADYDNDSKLDLYVCTDFASLSTRAEDPIDFVYYDANDGGKNYLFRNEVSSTDDWKFRDVTEETGMGRLNRRHSLAASWEDFDMDGDPDLYVANDYGQNCLFRNDAGKFVDIAPEAGVVDHGAGMSVSWGDFNRDGQMDIYGGNMFSSAGNRITRQPVFKEGADTTTKQLYQRMAKGNTLFMNLGDGKFREVSDVAGVELGRWAWSSLFVDLNNDGWEDLLVANGFLTSEGSVDL